MSPAVTQPTLRDIQNTGKQPNDVLKPKLQKIERNIYRVERFKLRSNITGTKKRCAPTATKGQQTKISRSPNGGIYTLKTCILTAKSSYCWQMARKLMELRGWLT